MRNEIYTPPPPTTTKMPQDAIAAYRSMVGAPISLLLKRGH